MTRRLVLASFLAVALSLSAGTLRPDARGGGLPARLTDGEFWRLRVESSEPDGYFRSDNLTSNELLYQHVIPDLMKRTRPGAVYLGVGPEQNFTYIAAVRPAFAVIFDIRRGNLLVQLMYKALFELSRDRAEFVSMLFSRPRPRGVGPASTAAELFAAADSAPADEARYARNLRAITAQLTSVHRFPLTTADLDGIDYAYHAFYLRGFAVRARPTYDELMTATDGKGIGRSYLAAEESFAFLKELHTRNLIVPVIGDFAGPKAIRAIAAYLKAHDASVTAFYLSNVEQYLYQGGQWTTFCRNVAGLPLDARSTFIRSSSGRRIGGFGGGFVSSLGSIAAEVRECQ